MRTQVTGTYKSGSFELRTEDGSLHRTVEPNEVFRVGNGIGGYWAKPISSAGKQMLALIRVSGSWVNRPTEQIRRRFAQERGTILQPGLGLWAETSGSARRGVWHRIREDADPIRNALRALGLPSNLVRTVDEIDQTVCQGGRFDRGGADRWWFVTDGSQELLSEELEEGRGGCRAFIQSQLRVRGGTFLVTGRDWDPEDCKFVRQQVRGVIVTPDADRTLVSTKVLKAGGSGVLG